MRSNCHVNNISFIKRKITGMFSKKKEMSIVYRYIINITNIIITKKIFFFSFLKDSKCKFFL